MDTYVMDQAPCVGSPGAGAKRTPVKGTTMKGAGVLSKPSSPVEGDTIKVPWHSDDPPSPQPSSSSSSEADVPLSAPSVSSSVVKLPPFALPLQSTLLKRITSAKTKEELLDFLSRYIGLLDHINLVTCVYRIAKLSYSTRSRATFLTELQQSGTFQLLLRAVHSTFLQAHFKAQRGMEVKGLDARCLSNLVWSLVKLDLPADPDSLSTSIALDVVPFVLKSLHNCSPQGLANMLWAYSRLPVGSPMLLEVVQSLVECITQQLDMRHDHHNRPFDAQALSNSVWALAHLKGRGLEVDPASTVLLGFVEAVARTAGSMLSQMQQRADFGNLQVCHTYLTLSEAAFSCQALVNIAWSLATTMGALCASHSTVRQLFHLIHNESVARLHASANLLRAGRTLPTHASGGGFNEQALSNAVFAFDKAGLLRKDLLENIFMVAALRLARTEHDCFLAFKPQELCTLLKACHNSVASPTAFLAALFRAVAANPSMVQSWSCSEQNELSRAYQLFYEQHQNGGGQAAGHQRVEPVLSQLKQPVLVTPMAVPLTPMAATAPVPVHNKAQAPRPHLVHEAAFRVPSVTPIALGTSVGGAPIAGSNGAFVMVRPRVA